MIEHPEAATIARQMSAELAGKRIASAERGNSPHKFAFYSGSPEEYAAILQGRTMGEATAHGPYVLAFVEPDYLLILGNGGERRLLHRSEDTLPKKHHLLLRFEDGAMLTVTVQGWGFVQLSQSSQLAAHPHVDLARVSPLSDDFSYDYFQELFRQLEAGDACSVKYFLISKPGVLGIGNGYLQDILFGAGIHPRRKAGDLSGGERRALFEAVVSVLSQATDLGGRDTERDLHNRPGRYRALLDRRSVGGPCPCCGTPIVKVQYLGGACYFCPTCQTQ